jgi:hypothetical protein
MKGVARAKIELGLVGKARGCAKVIPLYRESRKAFGAKARECRQRGRAIFCAEGSRPQFHRKRGRKFRRRPVADRQFGCFLSGERDLRKASIRFVR